MLYNFGGYPCQQALTTVCPSSRRDSRLPRWLLFLAASACLGWNLAVAVEPLRLTSSTREPYFLPDDKGFLDRIIPEIFRRAGADAVAVQYDAAVRVNINANTGVDDGAAMRSRLLQKEYSNLILVDEKFIDMDFVVFSREREFPVTGFAALRAMKASGAYERAFRAGGVTELAPDTGSP